MFGKNPQGGGDRQDPQSRADWRIHESSHPDRSLRVSTRVSTWQRGRKWTHLKPWVFQVGPWGAEGGHMPEADKSYLQGTQKTHRSGPRSSDLQGGHERDSCVPLHAQPVVAQQQVWKVPGNSCHSQGGGGGYPDPNPYPKYPFQTFLWCQAPSLKHFPTLSPSLCRVAPKGATLTSIFPRKLSSERLRHLGEVTQFLRCKTRI